MREANTFDLSLLILLAIIWGSSFFNIKIATYSYDPITLALVRVIFASVPLLILCKIKKIKCGAGFHAWHYENGDVANSRRTFVIQIYLNDDFDGGETEFLYQNKREKASAGDVLIFPCQYTHVHRGNPPIDGDKYLVTSWAWIQ